MDQPQNSPSQDLVRPISQDAPVPPGQIPLREAPSPPLSPLLPRFKLLKRRTLPEYPTKDFPGTYEVYYELAVVYLPLGMSMADIKEMSRVEYIRRLQAKSVPVPAQGLEYTFQVA